MPFKQKFSLFCRNLIRLYKLILITLNFFALHFGKHYWLKHFEFLLLLCCSWSGLPLPELFLQILVPPFPKGNFCFSQVLFCIRSFSKKNGWGWYWRRSFFSFWLSIRILIFRFQLCQPSCPFSLHLFVIKRSGLLRELILGVSTVWK